MVASEPGRLALINSISKRLDLGTVGFERVSDAIG